MTIRDSNFHSNESTAAGDDDGVAGTTVAEIAGTTTK